MKIKQLEVRTCVDCSNLEEMRPREGRSCECLRCADAYSHIALQQWHLERTRSAASLLLTTHTNESRTDPHQGLGEHVVSLLLGVRKARVASVSLLKTLHVAWECLEWNTAVLTPNEAILFVRRKV